ncbi:DUF1232 domain-containing protein [Frankia sp. Ag45/Mut15]|uniref:DUF1232 domain-containing protein n=1 Tax=Frankia umida TaxID=573489 RepID=A0ABT0JWK6_9ACTN|nr:DUF1232 domain-containing protein [Frankia umida]MCK9875871.1 DUF1232 domain-containing protein [Frankia umida]
MATLDKDALLTFGREVVTFLPDLVVMLRRVVADPRVPHSAKVEAAVALAYLASPKNRVTNMIPVVGQLDDVAIVAFAFRRLVVGAGEPILREHWRGSDRGFQVLIGASAALASPAGAVRKAKVARSLVVAGIDRVRPGHAARGASGGDPPRIVDGEVVSRADWVTESDAGPAGGGAGSGSWRGRRDRDRDRDRGRGGSGPAGGTTRS